MKSDYLNDQYLLETEQEQDFWKKMQDQLLFINEIPAIGNFDAYEKLAQHGYLDTVMPYISSDFEVFKLYLATHVAKCHRSRLQVRTALEYHGTAQEGCLRPNHKGENTEGAGKCHAPSSG